MAYSVTAASVRHSVNAIIDHKIAGAAITAGQAVYFDPSDDSVKLADCNAASPLYKVAGVAVSSAASGQDVAVCRRDPLFTPGITFSTLAAVVCLGDTAGGMIGADELTTGFRTQVLGVPLSSTTMNLFDVANCRADAAIA